MGLMVGMDGRVLGIDISSTTVCAVLAGIADDGIRIEAYAQAARAAGEPPWKALAGALEALRHRADYTGVACVASIPDSQVSYRRIRMPFSDARKIEKVIAYEMEPLIPFAPGDIMIDFCICAPGSAEGKEAGVDVLAAVIEKKKLTAWIEGFAGAGLQPEMILPRGWSAAAVLSSKEPGALLVDVAGENVTVCLAGKGDVQWVRAFSTGDAKAAKREGKLCAGLRHTLLAYEEEAGKAVVPEKAFILGPDGRSADVVKTVTDCLGMAPRPLNLAVEFDLVASRQPGHGWDPGLYDTALSLVLLKKARKICLNLRKGEFAPAGRWLGYRHLFGGTAVLAVVTLVLGLLGFFYDFYSLHRAISAVDARRQAIFKACFPESAAVASAETLRYEIDRLRETSGLPEGMKRKFYQIDILNDISRLIPKETDVVINRLDAGLSDVSLSGNTDSFQSVDAMKSRLETSEMFAGVVISSATMDKTDKRVHFKLQVELKL